MQISNKVQDFTLKHANPEEEYTDEELLSMAREIIWSGNGPDVWAGYRPIVGRYRSGNCK